MTMGGHRGSNRGPGGGLDNKISDIWHTEKAQDVLYFSVAAVAVSAITLGFVHVPMLGVALLGFLALAVSMQRLRFFVALAGISLPFAPIAVLPVGGIVVPVCDILAMIAVASYLMFKKNRPKKSWPESSWGSILKPAAPALILFIPYVVTAAANTAFNFPHTGYAVIIQRTEIVVVWLLFGAVIATAGMLRTFLQWYVGACVVVSLLWISSPGVGAVFGMQKNSSGGYIMGALLIVVLSGIRDRFRLPLMLLLIAGLIATGSRGSILSVCIAIAFFAFFVKQWKRVVAPLLAAAAAGLVAFQFLPPAAQARLLSEDEGGQFNIDIRGLFVRDALEQWAVSPWTGVGVGNYRQRATGLQQVLGYDPHNVYVLALTEGGYLHAAAFLLLVGGTLIWVLRMPKTSLTVLAITVQVAILVHSYIDVYWVRGTPALGFVLMAAAAAASYQPKREPATSKATVGPARSRLRV